MFTNTRKKIQLLKIFIFFFQIVLGKKNTPAFTTFATDLLNTMI